MTAGKAGFRESIHQRAAAAPKRIVFPEGDEPRTLDAVVRSAAAGLLHPTVLGERVATAAKLTARGADLERVTIIDPASDERRAALVALLAERRAHRGWSARDAEQHIADPLVFGAMLVRAGFADGFVAGAGRTTGDVIRAAIWGIGTAPGITTISSSFYMIVPPFRGADEVLTFTDCAVVADPTARELADIAAAAVAARRRIVGDEPRVAFLSFSTKGSASHPGVTRVQEGCALFRSEHPDVIADGELQADAALIEAVSRRKAPSSELAGSANVLVFPGLDAGNIAYKLVQRIGGADAVGPVLQGLDRPCSDLSRGASVDDIVDVACVTALQA